MSKRFSIILVVLVIVSGLIGGVFSGRIFNAKSAIAEENNVLKANELNIMDKNGKLVLTGSGLILYDEQGNKCLELDKSGLKSNKTISVEGNFISSKESHVFHRNPPICNEGRKIIVENMIFFATYSDALKADKTPCEICKPKGK